MLNQFFYKNIFFKKNKVPMKTQDIHKISSDLRIYQNTYFSIRRGISIFSYLESATQNLNFYLPSHSSYHTPSHPSYFQLFSSLFSSIYVSFTSLTASVFSLLNVFSNHFNQFALILSTIESALYYFLGIYSYFILSSLVSGHSTHTR